ncbi:MAG: protein kinase family protein [Candidatus Nanopelagicales bacterium]
MSGTRAGGRGRAQGLYPDLVVLGRYRLVDRVADNGGTSLWRGVDDRLRRPVAVRFMPLDTDKAQELRASAAAASHVTDRRAVPVLDIDQDLVTERLVIVTEWLPGTALGDLLASRPDPMPAREAGTVALEVARFLAAAEAEGVAHGRIRPNSVVVTDTGEVRVRGLGVDSVLYGVEPGDDAVAADLHGVGAILYACLTGRWPAAETGLGLLDGDEAPSGPLLTDGLPPAPVVDRGRVPWPSRVVADVPRELDEVVARSMLTTATPKGRGRYTSVADVVAALQPAPVASAARPKATKRTGWPPVARAAAVVVAVLAAVGLFWLGVSMVTGLGSPAVTTARTDTPRPSTPAASTVSGTPVAPGTRVVPIVSVKDFDPFGDTREENPQLAPLAVDGDPQTAWTTVVYRQPDLSGKPGVGLLLDLGAPRPVSAVDLRLLGNGTDVSILATDDPTKDPSAMRSMAEVTGTGNAIVLRVPRPVTTRYLVVWLTAIPPQGTRYQGGVAEVKVLG